MKHDTPKKEKTQKNKQLFELSFFRYLKSCFYLTYKTEIFSFFYAHCFKTTKTNIGFIHTLLRVKQLFLFKATNKTPLWATK